MLQKFPMYAYLPAKDVARARRFYAARVVLAPAAGSDYPGVEYGVAPQYA